MQIFNGFLKLGFEKFLLEDICVNNISSLKNLYLSLDIK